MMKKSQRIGNKLTITQLKKGSFLFLLLFLSSIFFTNSAITATEEVQQHAFVDEMPTGLGGAFFSRSVSVSTDSITVNAPFTSLVDPNTTVGHNLDAQSFAGGVLVPQALVGNVLFDGQVILTGQTALVNTDRTYWPLSLQVSGSKYYIADVRHDMAGTAINEYAVKEFDISMDLSGNYFSTFVKDVVTASGVGVPFAAFTALKFFEGKLYAALFDRASSTTAKIGEVDIPNMTFTPIVSTATDGPFHYLEVSNAGGALTFFTGESFGTMALSYNQDGSLMNTIPLPAGLGLKNYLVSSQTHPFGPGSVGVYFLLQQIATGALFEAWVEHKGFGVTTIKGTADIGITAAVTNSKWTKIESVIPELPSGMILYFGLFTAGLVLWLKNKSHAPVA